MRLPRLSILFTLGLFLAGSTALGYYYFYFYGPPLKTADAFMRAMETRNAAALKQLIVISRSEESGDLREPEERDVAPLLAQPFVRGRVVDQHRREGKSRDFYNLVYRQPDGQVYFLVLTTVSGRFRIVIPEMPVPGQPPYLLEYMEYK